MTDAVILTCHGTISDPKDVPAFLAAIRRGRAAPPELVQEVIRRYDVIGGSPLMEISRRQASLLEGRLGIPVKVAGRLWHPYPAEILAELVASGARRVLSLPLAPQSVHVYHEAVKEAATGFPALELVLAPAWGAEPRFVDALVETIDEGLPNLSPGTDDKPPIVLSAHSLPLRALASGDPYERDFRALAELVATRMRSRGHRVEVAFQSQGASSEPWLGPTLADVFRSLVGAGFDSVFVAPIGFVAEHVETLYDLDVEARETAKNAGLAAVARARAVSDKPAFIDALETVCRRALGPGPTAPAASR